MVELPLCLGRLGCGFTYRGPISETLNLSVFVQVSFLQFPHVEKGYLRWCFLIFWGGPKPSNPILIAFESHVTNVNPYFWLTSKMNKSRTPRKLMMKTMKTMISSGQTWSHHFFLDGSAHPAFFPPGPRPPQAQKALRRQLQQLRSEGEYPDSKLCTPQ